MTTHAESTYNTHKHYHASAHNTSTYAHNTQHMHIFIRRACGMQISKWAGTCTYNTHKQLVVLAFQFVLQCSMLAQVQFVWLVLDLTSCQRENNHGLRKVAPHKRQQRIRLWLMHMVLQMKLWLLQIELWLLQSWTAKQHGIGCNNGAGARWVPSKCIQKHWTITMAIWECCIEFLSVRVGCPVPFRDWHNWALAVHTQAMSTGSWNIGWVNQPCQQQWWSQCPW